MMILGAAARRDEEGSSGLDEASDHPESDSNGVPALSEMKSSESEANESPQAKKERNDAALVLQRCWRNFLEWRIMCEQNVIKAGLLIRWSYYLHKAFKEPTSSRFAKGLSLILNSLIVISIVGYVVETEPGSYGYHAELQLLEVICTFVFCLEYLSRFIICFHSGQTKRQFVASPVNIADLIAILPWFLEKLFEGGDAKLLKVARSVRLVRLTRLFKLAKYAYGFRLMMMAIKNSASILLVLGVFIILGAVFFCSSTFLLRTALLS